MYTLIQMNFFFFSLHRLEKEKKNEIIELVFAKLKMDFGGEERG